jgi:hypothetical protein
MKRIFLVAFLACLVPAVAKADRGHRYGGHGGSHSGFSISLGFGSGSYGNYSNVGFGYSRGYRGGYGGYYSRSYYAPVYVAPAPVYVAPPVVYQPTYCPPPVVYAPAPRVYYYDPAPCYTPRYHYDSGVRFSYHR